MGGFALLAPGADGAAHRVEAVFRSKGLPATTRSRVGEALLLGFGRALQKDGLQATRGGPAWTFGTPILPGLDHASAQARLAQQGAGTGTAAEIGGAFCRVGSSGGKATVEADRLGLFPLFADEIGTILSSSQEALLAALPSPAPLCREALLERLLTGTVVAPRTLFEGVRLLGPRQIPRYRADHWSIASPRPLVPLVAAAHDTKEAAGLLLEVLRPQVRDLARFADGGGISLGLSGGYDSRLLLGLMRGGGRLDLHTYSSPAHAREEAIARRLARSSGLRVRALPVRPWDGLGDEDLAANANDAIRLWDGRGNDTMGTFADVHTGRLRARAAGESALALNGLGGELFRNRENAAPWTFSVREWILTFAIGAPEREVLRVSAGGLDVVQGMAERWAALIDLPPDAPLDATGLRRLYAEVWLPHGAGPRLATENQLTCAAMPFASPAVVEAALGVSAAIGLGGRCESRMIRDAAPDLADVESSYGFPLGHYPVRQRLRDGASAARPGWLRRAMEDASLRPDEGLAREVARRDVVRQAFELVARLVEPWDLRPLLRFRASRDRVLAVGWFLRLHAGEWRQP